jgi:hypothetical protein
MRFEQAFWAYFGAADDDFSSCLTEKYNVFPLQRPTD